MKRTAKVLVTLATVVVGTLPALAVDIGNPAPALTVGKWVKGDAVKLADGKGKNVYVIEFWISNCPHSQACIPHLTALQKKYKDKGVIVIGISPSNAEELSKFVKLHDSEIGYRVAADQAAKTYLTYCRASGIHTIPHAFVIDKSGRVVWSAHPMSGLDKVVEAVLAGTYDIEQSRKAARARRYLDQYFKMSKSITHAANAAPIGKKIIEDGESDALLLNSFAWRIASEPGLIKRDLKLAQQAVEIANKATDGKNSQVLDTYARIMFVAKDYKQAAEWETKAIAAAGSDEERTGYEKTLKDYVAAAEKK